MKVFEILDDGMQYELMYKLLTKQGLDVDETTIRNKRALKVRLFGRTGRVQLKGDKWYMDVIGNQGHKIDSATGDEAAVADYFQPWLERKPKLKEDLLSKAERTALLKKLLSASGFFAKIDVDGLLKVFHVGDWTFDIKPHGQGWKAEASGIDYNVGDIVRVEKRCKDEQAVIDYLSSMRSVKEAQDDDVPLVWKLAAQEKAKRKRVSIEVTVDNMIKGLSFITGEIMVVDIPAAQVQIYAYGRTWVLPMRSEDDSRYTLEKDSQSDFYWVKDIEHEAE